MPGLPGQTFVRSSNISPVTRTIPPNAWTLGHVEDDLVAGLDLLGHVAAALLGPDQPEAALARGAEVLERAGEHPGGHPTEGYLWRMADERDLIGPDETAFRLELTPPQLKIVHTALKSLLDDFGHDEPDVHRIVHEVLDKLPDEHSIRAIDISTD